MSARSRIVLAAAAALLAIALFWWRTTTDIRGKAGRATPERASTQVDNNPNKQAGPLLQSTTTPEPTQPQVDREQTLRAAFLKPIDFWGKVVDQDGNPVAGATVDWSANNNPDPYGSGTKGRTETDASGMFSVTSQGIGLFVKTTKNGYAQIPTELRGQRGSLGRFSNASKLGNTDSPMGTRSDPAVFVLRKKGEAAELIHVSERPVKVPKNGGAVAVALGSGKVVASGKGDLQIECWTEEEKRDVEGHYPWRCRVSIPGGGLVKRTTEHEFEAPAEGYQIEDEIVPPQDRWSDTGERMYFVKTADGHFARVTLRMYTGGDQFAVLESYLNPQPDNRNLEYEPSR